MRYYIIAGEASGDLHASNLMKGLYGADSGAVIRFRGGDRMEEVWREHEGGKAGDGSGKAFDYRDGAVMGFFELLGKLGSILREMSLCRRDVEAFRPDVIIPVDYPGFNLKMASWAHRHGFKVFWYIAPKVWATREWRIRSLKKYVDRLFIVFPFEKAYFDAKGLDCIYCGNPLTDAVESSHAMTADRELLRDELLQADAASADHTGGPLVALLAGSRLNEVNTMMPLFRELIALMRSDPRFEGCRYIIAGAPGRTESDYGDYDKSCTRLVFGKTQEIVRAADAAVINSGTASLEAVLLGTPQVVAYKVPSRLTYLLAKHFLFKAKFISLGNLCLGRQAFRELYKAEGRKDRNGILNGGQDDCTAGNVALELKRLLSDRQYRDKMKEAYSEICVSLGGSGASARVAERLVSELRAL